MTITFYRYYISSGCLKSWDIEIKKETDKCYFGWTGQRFLKENDNTPVLKDRTSYPYIDFYDTKDNSRLHAVDRIVDFFRNKWGLK